MAMAVSHPRVPAFAIFVVLLQACTTTGGPSAQRPDAGDPTQIATKPQSSRLPIPPATADNAEPDFKGPQIVFAPGSAEVPRNADALLDDIAAKLKADPLVNVKLIGHTEDMGSTEFSVAVAGRCTQAVGQALIKRGARPNQIRMVPRGHDKIARRCTTAACKKQMRRVDIVMSNY
jgi:outer membrane protein OmpA-like peptidoglycan-associated protein